MRFLFLFAACLPLFLTAASLAEDAPPQDRLALAVRAYNEAREKAIKPIEKMIRDRIDVARNKGDLDTKKLLEASLETLMQGGLPELKVVQGAARAAERELVRAKSRLLLEYQDVEREFVRQGDDAGAEEVRAERSDLDRHLTEAVFTSAERRKAGQAHEKPTGPEPKKPPTNSIGMELVSIPKGKFMMGEGGGAVGVILTKPFWLGKYEVTQGQFKKVMGTEPWVGHGDVQIGEDNAASYVDWNNATAFCQRLTDTDHKNGKRLAGESYRLPTDAEWEYACRAGTQTTWSFGNDESQLGNYGWFAGNAQNVGQGYAHKVGMKKPNPAGLFDMHGNVWEWCSDWIGSGLSGGTDPVGPGGGTDRVLRGGSLYHSNNTRSSHRGNGVPSIRIYDLGFRVARSQSAQ